MTLLRIDSSPLGEASASRTLTAAIADALKAARPDLSETYRDLAEDAPRHLDGTVLQAMGAQSDDGLAPEVAAERALNETLLDEFLGADTVIIGAPMYNFAIPSTLKAWIDRIAQAGRTFRYTESGSEGLAGGKTVIIASSRGGLYAGTDAEAALDHQEAYLKAFMGFFGIDDVRVIRAEGLAMGPEAREQGLKAALAEIDGQVLKKAA